jgi:hypothetical protein
MRSRRLLPLIVILIWSLASAPGAAAPDLQESLDYQVSLGPWDDVARVHLVLQKLAPGRYRAEFTGAAQGLWRLLSRWLPERYTTEMVFRQGRLQPLVYREEFMNQGQHVLREYRFDYEHGRLTLWRQADGGKKVKKWQVPLKEPVYDLLSLFYNARLGTLGPLLGGATVKVAFLPTPKPQELVFRIGEMTGQGRKIMLNYRQPDSGRVDHYFIYLNPQRVPTLAWTRVIFFGKLSGRLLNSGEIGKAGLLALLASPPPVPEARR